MVAFPKCRFAEGADYSQALRGFAAALVVAALVAAATCACAQSSEFGSEVEARVVNLTNEVRATAGLAPLQGETRLVDAARGFASYIASTGRLEHDADGTTPAERVKKRGYAYCIVAENLGMEYSSAGFTPERLSRNVIDGWMGSATHRGNMLQPDITQIGVGVSRSRNGEYYVVQVFGRPLSQMTRFRVANRANATVRYDYRERGVTLGPRQARNHESCLAGTVKVDSSGQDVVLQPKDGGRYAITESARGVYRIAEE